MNTSSDDIISNGQQLKIQWGLHWKLDPDWPARKYKGCDLHAGSLGLRSRSRLAALRLRASPSRSKLARRLPSSLGLARTRRPATLAVLVFLCQVGGFSRNLLLGRTTRTWNGLVCNYSSEQSIE